MAKLILAQFIAIIIVTSIRQTSCLSSSQNLGTNQASNTFTVVQAVEIENFQVFTKIKYRYARTMVFCQMYNPHPSQGQEALFQLDLPQEAFISNFTMEINGHKQYKSFIKERKEANEKYVNARGSGATAAIVNKDEQYFNVSINLAANSSVLFFLEYEQEIPKLHVGQRHIYEYVLSFIPEIIKVQHFCVEIDILEYKPFVYTSVNVRNKFGNSTILDLQKDAIIIERENRTIIIWEPPTGKLKQLLESGIVGKFSLNYEFNSSESVNDIVIRNGYFVHRFNPPALEKLPLYVIFVLDTSDSMIGVRGNRTKLAMEKVLLNNLNANQDFFHVITFSSSVQHLDLGSNIVKRFYPVTPNLVNGAKDYIDKQIFDGSTNIFDALSQALETAANCSALHKEYCQQLADLGVNSPKCSKNNSIPTPMIFFLTDGYPTSGIIDGQTILTNVQTKNTNPVPIYSIGLGTEADHSLLEALSTKNHGISRRIYNDADVVLQLEDFYKLVGSPVLKDINFGYTSSRNSESNFIDVSFDADLQPWLSSEDEIVVTGKLYENSVDTNQNGQRSTGHHLSSHHGLHYHRYTTLEVGNEDAKFTARICHCGRCPPLNENNKGTNDNNETDFLSNFKRDGLFCPRNDEDDRFMQRFWVYKTLQKLIKEVVASGSERIKQEIIGLSKQYHLVTPLTSLLILTPIDKKGSNRKDHVSPSVPDIMKSSDSSSFLNDNNGIQESFLDRGIYPRKIDYYSGSLLKSSNNGTADNQTANERPSLVSYLKSLRDAQDIYVQNVTNHQNLSSTTMMPIKLSINDIKWVHGQNFSLHLKNKRNEASVYHILRKGAIIGTKSNHPCISAAKQRSGICLHLETCLEPDYLTNITLFVKGYFCPIIIEPNTKYIGTCCTKLNTT